MFTQIAEQWQGIPGFPNYSVSTMGRIRSRQRPCSKGGLLKPYLHPSTGYLHLHLYRDGVSHTQSVHFLVALTFLGPRPFRMDINHKDGNKQNNRLSNLEYVTSRENQRHAFQLGLKHGRPKLTREMAEQIRLLYRAGGCSQRQISQRFQVCQQSISKVVAGRRWPEEGAAA